MNDIGEEEWSKYTFVGNLGSTKPGALCFDNEYVYSMNEYYNNQWHDGKFALSDGTYTNLGFIDGFTYSNSSIDITRPFKAAAIGDYLYCAGYKNGDDYLAIYSIPKDGTSGNFYITDALHANIGTTDDGVKCVQFTDNGSGQGTVTYGQGFGLVGDAGAYLTLDLDNGSCSFNISKQLAGSNTPRDRDHIGACVTDSEGNTYVVGQLRQMSSGNSQTFFIKFNSSGVTQWIKMLSGASINSQNQPKFDGYICSEGNIHLAYWMYEPSWSWTPSVQITTFDSSGNLISITRVQIGGNYIDGQQDMVMENDGFAMISPELFNSGNGVVVLRFPLNTDISYTSSYVKIEYDTTRTWSDGNSSEFSISNGYTSINLLSGTRPSPTTRTTYNESGNTITTTEVTY